MTHIWQGLRSGRWLTAARARGYSLILLGICAIAMAGWIAVSDGLIDRNGKPLGTDFSNVYAAGSLTWQGRPAEAYDSRRCSMPPRRPCSAAARCRSTAGIIRRSSSRSPFWSPPFPMRWGSFDLAGGESCGLSGGDARDPAAAGNAADRGRLPGGVRQSSAMARTDF